jgi:hypothetical protein
MMAQRKRGFGQIQQWASIQILLANLDEIDALGDRLRDSAQAAIGDAVPNHH